MYRDLWIVIQVVFLCLNVYFWRVDNNSICAFGAGWGALALINVLFNVKSNL